MQVDWAPLFGIVAALTIVVGNWAAVTQENSKRLLAYSSISNAGYLLLGIIANNSYGNIGLVIYLVVYTLMNMGAFGVIISLRRRGIIGDNVDDMTGLAQKAPGMAAMMAIFMLSLGGLPAPAVSSASTFCFGDCCIAPTQIVEPGPTGWRVGLSSTSSCPSITTSVSFA